jgi:hypothetical protein
MSIKIPKIMHFYWDMSKLSYLQYMTIISFKKQNPDWDIIIHENEVVTRAITWDTDEQRILYNGYDWYPELKKLPYVKLNYVDFEKIGFKNDVPEVFKSDFLRWYLLSTVGGGWSDIDILYLKPINTIDIDNSDTVICFRGDVHIIGFYLSKPENPFFKKILDNITIDFDRTKYQSIGSTLLNTLYPSIDNIDMDIKLKNISMDVVYPYRDGDINILFNEIDLNKLKEETIGVHWYNGSRISKIFNQNYDQTNNNINNTITEILKMI